MTEPRSFKYVAYQETIYLLIGISFSQNLNDYTFHLLDVEIVQSMLEGHEPDAAKAIKAPIEECRELEGRDLEVARMLYEQPRKI